MTTSQLTAAPLANTHRVQLRDLADAARLTAAVPTDLISRLAAAPGLVRPGIAHWDMKTRLPLHPLSIENAYGDARLLRDLAVPGATYAHQLNVDVVVGAETGGIPLAAAVALAADLPFAFVRKPGYVGHEDNEPRVRGASVAGKRVLLVDDAISQGTALEAFANQLRLEGAILVGAFTLVDMRDVADSVTPTALTLPIASVATYLQVLDSTTDLGILQPAIHDLAVDALINHWPDQDPRWSLLAA
ncbi:phosphoribosyltransferase family protein [Kribbella sp. NPDC050241]|uniref:phosphoribosyltransferase family protein n=1 Tax=Kribbella sp. NPDC050241 TaxID=3364115 RepID=UPI00378D9A88